MAYVEVRPVRVADLLLREGHPLTPGMTTGSGSSDPGWTARRTLGVAAGALLVIGTVAAGALGLGGGPVSPPSSAGEPLGVVPPGVPQREMPAPEQRPVEVPAAPEAATPQFTNSASTGAASPGEPARRALPA
ncbi:hypothetical protein, partial [Actinophytocola sp.]|uniref:hypothetical protein n=1 Tax=Actinophytocola sp. TaxID=1872138 RepID=UPI002D8C8E14|nr:hypothetical protein [Actinophytocola sp.]